MGFRRRHHAGVAWALRRSISSTAAFRKSILSTRDTAIRNCRLSAGSVHVVLVIIRRGVPHKRRSRELILS